MVTRAQVFVPELSAEVSRDVFHIVAASTGIQPFGRLVDQVMTSEPYAQPPRVFWAVDNGSSHRGQASIARLQGG